MVAVRYFMDRFLQENWNQSKMASLFTKWVKIVTMFMIISQLTFGDQIAKVFYLECGVAMVAISRFIAKKWDLHKTKSLRFLQILAT